jgi:hypothetical protein
VRSGTVALRDASAVNTGDPLRIQLAGGELDASVTEVRP